MVVLDIYKKKNQLEFELGRFESDLENVEEEITSIGSRRSPTILASARIISSPRYCQRPLRSWTRSTSG